MADEWVAGVAIRLVGAAGINLGMILQKSSLNRNDAREATDRRSCLRQKRWVAGTGTLALGHVLTFLSLSYASASLIAVLGAFSLVTNPLFAWLILGERPFAAHGLSIALIGVGCSLVVVYADHGAQEYSPGDLTALWSSAGAISLVAACAALILGMAVGWWRKQQGAELETAGDSPVSGTDTPGDGSPRGAVHKPSAPEPSSWTVVALIVGSAVCGAWSFVFAKVLAQLLKYWGPSMLGSSDTEAASAAVPDGEVAPHSLAAYAFALGMVACVAAAGVTQVYVIQQAFRQKRGRALLVIADYFAVHTLLTTLFATTYFDEWSSFAERPFEGGMFLLGVALAIAGVRVDHVIESRLAEGEGVGGVEGEVAGTEVEAARVYDPESPVVPTRTFADAGAPVSEAAPRAAGGEDGIELSESVRGAHSAPEDRARPWV